MSKILQIKRGLKHKYRSLQFSRKKWAFSFLEDGGGEGGGKILKKLIFSRAKKN
jgi:hypothetical protein